MQLIAWSDSSPIVFAVVLLALVVSSVVACRAYRATKETLSRSRQRAAFAALVCTVTCLILYLVDLAWFQIILRTGAPYRQAGWAASGGIIIAATVLSLLGIVGGVAGRGLFRALTILDGITLLVLWWLLGLGTST